ncbi:MAG: hypothetical protein OEY03_04785 [Rhizobacter sp.]|nr:hypothetical protein [Rhizobacter sp.]
MNAITTRKTGYGLAGLLALAYVIYVLVSKFFYGSSTGVLGEVGESGLVLASVIAFSIGLLADEAVRTHDPH